MSELTTAARPYAKAAFQVAKESDALATWSQQLGFMALVAEDAQMRAVLDSPRLTRQTMAEAFLAVCADHVDANGQNFVHLLADNARLRLLPEISRLFELLKAEAEKKVEAQVVSAQEVSAAQQEAIASALKQRLGREVALKCVVDDSLIGGAIVRAGDLVIDGSVRGRLQRLASSLSR